MNIERITPESQQAIGDAIRRHCLDVGLTFIGTQSCVDLGRVLNIYRADQAESIRKGLEMADVIANEVRLTAR